MKYDMKRLRPEFYSGHIALIISLALIFGGIYEATAGYLQLFGFQPSGNSRFPVTGNFFNPGPYCAFLACILPIAADAVIARRSKLLEYAGWVYIFMAACLMPMLMGRTGWIAAIGGVMYVYLKADDNFIRFKTFFQRRKVYLMALGIATTIFILLFILFKPESASGRLLLWIIGFDAWLDNFWTGIGWDKVAGAIGDAQEQYFHAHPDSAFAMVAGCPEYAFNEYLQIAIAFGVGGLLLFLILISAGIYFSSKSGLYGLTGGWIAFAIVCIASYPLQFAEFRWLLVAFCVMTVVGFNQKPMSINSHTVKLIKCAICILLIFSGWILTRNIELPDKRSQQYFESGQSLRRRGKFAESNEVLAKGLTYSSDPMFLNIIGRNMQDMGRYEEAEKYYLRSITRLPSRLYPRYLLAKLYASPEYFSPEKFRSVYDDAMHMEIKVSSPAVSDMQRELRQLNDSVQKNCPDTP